MGQSAGGSAIGAEGGAGGDGRAAGNTYGRKLQGHEQPPKPVKPTPSTVNYGGNGGNGGNADNKGKVTGGNGGNGALSQPCKESNDALRITLHDASFGQHYSMVGVPSLS